MSSVIKFRINLRHLSQSLAKPLATNRLNYCPSHVFRRFCHKQTTSDDNNGSVGQSTQTSPKDMETIFLWPRVQTLLYRLIGFDEKKVFSIDSTIIQTTKEVRFMTDKELEEMSQMARKRVEEKLQMPPVLNPTEDEPKILSKDPEVQGFLDSKLVFVDSSSGYSDKTRLIVIREPNGDLREANREERYRLNQMFFPKEERLLHSPKMFEDSHLQAVLDRHDYLFVLDRACLQYEPNDPKYVHICHTTYDHILANKRFRDLHSTRHFGPFCLYLAFTAKMDQLLNYYILNEDITDGSHLVRLYYIIHSCDSQQLETMDSLELVKKYINEESKDKPILGLSVQKYEEIQQQKQSLSEDIQRAHGLTNS